MKLTKKQRKILENNFNIYEDKTSFELEAWTNGGVNMFIPLDKEEKENAIEQLENYINYFDIDEEIEIHRQGADYKQAFTIRESLEDFENWLEWVKNIVKSLKGVK